MTAIDDNYDDIVANNYEQILRATLDLPQRVAERNLRSTHKMPSLEPVHEEIKMARKPRMRTVEQYLCDRCDQVIKITESPEPPAGYVVHGNIYDANPSKIGGLIGNNFPIEPGSDGTIEFSEVKRTVLCRKCFMESLMLTPPTSSIRSDDARYSGMRVSDR